MKVRPMIAQLKGKKDLVGAEIGVWAGTNAISILENLDIKKLYLIDCYEIYDGWGFEVIGDIAGCGCDVERAKKRVKKDIREAKIAAEKKLKKHKDKVVWLQEMSHTAAKKIKDESLDFVYIDGNHTYEFVRVDILVWRPKVKIGGILGGHDFNADGVQKAVRELFPMSNWPAKPKKPNNDWWITKEEK